MKEPVNDFNPKAETNRLQTLDRGLRALQVMADANDGLTVAELASEMAINRAIAYRIVATLEDHGMVHRAPNGRLYLGPGLLTLAAVTERGLRGHARPILQELADQTGCCAFLSVAQRGECVAVASALPVSGFLDVSYRVGSRHPLTRGAAGISILALRPETADENPQITAARERGYALTAGQLQPGAMGIASGVPLSPARHAGLEVSIGIVTMGKPDHGFIAQAVMRAAAALSHEMGG